MTIIDDVALDGTSSVWKVDNRLVVSIVGPIPDFPDRALLGGVFDLARCHGKL